MQHRWQARWVGVLWFVVLGISFVGCNGSGSADAQASAFLSAEATFDATYLASPIALTGVIYDVDGTPLDAASATLVAWGDAEDNDGATATTNGAGLFHFPELARRSALLRVERTGYYTDIYAADLQRPLSEGTHDIGDIYLVPEETGRVRFIFGGDTMFGRRYEDFNEDGFGDTSEDLIHSDSRGEDAEAILEFLGPLLREADYTQINLECPVAESAVEEHPYKSFVFFSHPDTLAALTYAGIDGVSLGNNHVYDLLETGFNDTIGHLDDAGLDWFGGGTSESDAQARWLSGTTNTVGYGLQGFNGLLPLTFPASGPDPWPPELMYNATDTPIVKGGSLYFSIANLDDFLGRVPAGSIAIPVLHGGDEYSDFPSTTMRDRVEHSLLNGAGLVVGHHPHTLHGVATVSGGTEYALLSLGNLAFDQDVFETFPSVIAIVDVFEQTVGNPQVERVRLVPIHIEGYVPKAVAGPRADHIARHIGHLSTHLPDLADDLEGAVVFPANGRVVVCNDPSQYSTADSAENLVVEIEGGVSEPIPFDRSDPADMLASVALPGGATLEVGRDLLLYGGFEDHDVDDSYHEVSLWTQSTWRFPQNQAVRSGSGAFALRRDATRTGYTSTWVGNRIAFTDGLQLTLTGYLRGSNAGPVEIWVHWYDRDDDSLLESAKQFTGPAGSYSWEAFHVDLNPPAGAGTVRFYIRHYPAAQGEAILLLDDFALIQWESATTPATIDAPNNWSWLRVSAPSDGPANVGITHRQYTVAPGSH